MCGRTACTLAPDDIVKACTYKDGNGKRRHPLWKDSPGGQKYLPSYNVNPACHMPVLVPVNFDGSTTESSDRVVIPMKWGLTPSWHKGDPYNVHNVNCRSEGILKNQIFNGPLQKGFRCVVLADGYFEWGKKTLEGKQPYFFYFPQPKHISYPGEAVKTELNSDIKGERTVGQETHVDKAITQEVMSHNVKNETEDLQNPDVKIKEEIPSNTCPEHEQNVSTSSSAVNPHKTENGSRETKPVKSFWNSFASDTEKENSSEQLPDETLLSALKESHSVATKIKNSDVGIGSDDDVPEWEGQRLLTMAGVYDVWDPPDGSPPLYSYSIITVPASPDIKWCHRRMPAILSTEDEVRDWLDSANIRLRKKQVSSLIKTQNGLVCHPVSKVVNNSQNKSADCIKPVKLGNPKESNMLINWLKSGSPAKKKKVE